MTLIDPCLKQTEVPTILLLLMMMPILDQNPAVHHLHGYGHETFYHQQHVPEQCGKMQLTLILPNGVPSVISVDASTPMMDLFVQATSLNKLNPSSYSLVVLDSNHHIIQFKANQTVGQIVQSCQLPQLNGSSTISLLPKDTSHSNPLSKPKTQPFEITVRLQINLPDGQKILLRIDPTLPLYEIKEQICKQKKYIDSNRYTLRLPNKLDQPLLLGSSLAEYKTNELTLVRFKQDDQYNKNQLQSFDRLYRTRSESQPPTETIQEVQNEQQELTNTKQRPASAQLNSPGSPTQGQNVTSLPTRSTRPITSHTSLHAYWNDPNFDTQSQTSNTSSTTKKRRAPKAPVYISPTLNEQQIILSDHHESHESLTESLNSTKQKRKAPVLPITTIPQETQTDEIIDEQQLKTNVESQNIEITMNSVDQQRLLNLLAEQKTPPTAKLVITTHSTDEKHVETHSPTPIYSQIQKPTKEIIQTESPYSTVQVSSTPPAASQQDEKRNISPTNYSIGEIVQAGIAEPPPKSPIKTSKESTPLGGLIKIIDDHNERAEIYQKNEKQAEDVSYFRVATSRHGKFETDSQGFVNNSNNIFDSTNTKQEQQPQEQQLIKTSEITTTTTQKSVPVVVQQQTKGKQAYDLLKKYEKEEENQQSQPIDTDYLKSTINDKENPPTPIQLEVTERTTHISVTVESDRKQLITRASPVPQQTSSSPSILAPKPFGKTITEYRTIRRIGNDGETTTTTTVRTETVPKTTDDHKQLTSTDNVEQTNLNPTTQHESLMESGRQFGGSENLNKN
ncbi:unnamed protein product [Rotaria sordida]|uniref:Uncharacterized protein n=1 Tax=Rotaria sordida TaxID=392033 RepID=A0A815E0X9_9BILA|nr:unnamed protein product [Rotaria sordida]CAF1298439.1 unnamed protein product [Rotaria sordida]CAF1305167.1 unnamed protein product [Rotaria sordida]